MSLSQKKLVISIQGGLGSFHHEAALVFFKNIDSYTLDFDTCMSFNDLGIHLADETSQVAVMAIENSIAGSILPNYDILDKHDFEIIAEYHMPILQNIMALKGQKIQDIEEVWSHHMALLQCRTYLDQYPNIKAIEYPDTADAARYIKEHNLENTAAIAGIEAANTYGLEVLDRDIQTIKDNRTRFFLIKKKETEIPFNPDKIDKASLKIVLKHEQGALAKTLQTINQHHLNLTKIQSVPIPEDTWNYAFFIDVAFTDYTHFQTVLAALKSQNQLSVIKILGEYKNDNP